MFTLTFQNIEQIDTIIRGLTELPFKVSNDLIQQVRGQAVPQWEAFNKPAESPTDADEEVPVE